MKLLDFVQNGLLQEYRRIWQLQRRLSETVSNVEDGYLLLVEHTPVYTSGKRMKEWSKSEEANRLRQTMSASTIETDRGGLLTFHGPGQLVVYPVLDVSTYGLRPYITSMEQTLIETCRALGLSDVVKFGEAGVAVGGRKVGFLGVAHQRGKVMHGASLNVNVELGYFQQIVPCGHVGLQITNLKDELSNQHLVTMDRVKRVYSECFEQIFKVKLHPSNHLLPRTDSYHSRNFSGQGLDQEALRIANRMYVEFRPEVCTSQQAFFCSIHETVFPYYCNYCTHVGSVEDALGLWKLVLLKLVNLRFIRLRLSDDSTIEEAVLKSVHSSYTFTQLLDIIGNETVAYIYVISLGLLYQ